MKIIKNNKRTSMWAQYLHNSMQLVSWKVCTDGKTDSDNIKSVHRANTFNGHHGI